MKLLPLSAHRLPGCSAAHRVWLRGTTYHARFAQHPQYRRRWNWLRDGIKTPHIRSDPCQACQFGHPTQLVYLRSTATRHNEAATRIGLCLVAILLQSKRLDSGQTFDSHKGSPVGLMAAAACPVMIIVHNDNPLTNPLLERDRAAESPILRMEATCWQVRKTVEAVQAMTECFNSGSCVRAIFQSWDGWLRK